MANAHTATVVKTVTQEVPVTMLELTMEEADLLRSLLGKVESDIKPLDSVYHALTRLATVSHSRLENVRMSAGIIHASVGTYPLGCW
jgi:hypothetical protein